MTAPPGRTSDLVRDSQLRTAVSLGLTHHTYYESNLDSQRRRTRIKETWRRGRELGNGTFGRVWQETCEAGPKCSQLRAVKEIPKDRTLSSSIDYARELEAMAKFSHDRYVHCFVRSFGWYESRNAVFIAMEYIQHGDLQKYLVAIFPEAEVKQIASQIAEGLFFMHDNGFAHRDLKPANILVTNPRPDWWVKISDFGISKRAEAGSVLRTFVGTRGYLAPELIGVFTISDRRSGSNSRSQSAYTTAVDMWALGEIAVRLLTRRSTFPESHDLFDYVVHQTPFPRQVFEGQDVSNECFAFIEKAMAPSPSQRLLAREAMAHPWLQTSRASSPASSGGSSRFIDSSSLLRPPREDNDGIISMSESSFVASANWSTLSPSEVLTEQSTVRRSPRAMLSQATTMDSKVSDDISSQAEAPVVDSAQAEKVISTSELSSKCLDKGLEPAADTDVQKDSSSATMESESSASRVQTPPKRAPKDYFASGGRLPDSPLSNVMSSIALMKPTVEESPVISRVPILTIEEEEEEEEEEDVPVSSKLSPPFLLEPKSSESMTLHLRTPDLQPADFQHELAVVPREEGTPASYVPLKHNPPDTLTPKVTTPNSSRVAEKKHAQDSPEDNWAPVFRSSTRNATLAPSAPLQPSPLAKVTQDITTPNSSRVAQKQLVQELPQGPWTPVFRSSEPVKTKHSTVQGEHDSSTPSTQPRHSPKDPYEMTTVEPDEVVELTSACTTVLKARGKLSGTSYVWHPFQKSRNLTGSSASDFIRRFFSDPISTSPLLETLRALDSAVISAILRWCWARIPGGLVDWNVYELFQASEKRNNMSRSEFSHFVVFLEVYARQRIMLNFLDLLAYDVLGPEFVRNARKRSLEAAWWVFQLKDVGRFDEGYASWLRAADATAHLLYAYLRKYYDPERGGSNAAKLVRMYVEPHYPPKMSSLLQKRACKVVLEVRELASTPWELLERAGRTDGVPAVLRELIGFSSTKRLTPECLNVLDAIERHVQQWDSRDASDDHEQRPAFRQQTHLSAARVINVTQMALDEDFWRAWVQSNSPEETPERSLMFGQSIVVRTQQRDLVFGGTVTANDSSDVPEWVVFEEVKAVKKVKDMEAEEGNTFKKYNAIRRFNMPKFKSPRRPMRLGKSNDVNEAQQ